MKSIKTQKGITLIALVITIIILLILAAVSINIILGQDGILQRAKDAKEKTEIAQEKEILQLSLMDIMLRNNGKLVFDEETLKSAIERNSNIDGIEVEKVADNMYMVIFNTSKRYYEVNSEGNVKTTVAKVNDETPGDWEGDGTKENPYLIKSIEDLVALSDRVSPKSQETGTEQTYNSYENKWFRLENDFDFSSVNSYVDPDRTDFGDANDDGQTQTLIEEMTTGTGFRPIGYNSQYPFSGSIEGNGHTIYNLYVNNNPIYSAFIAYGSYKNINGTIQNLNFEDVNIKSTYYSGTIYGYLALEQTTMKISNCTFSGNVETTNYAGGIAGYVYDSNGNNTNVIIENVINNTNIKGGSYSASTIAYCEGVQNMKFKNVTNNAIIEGNDAAGIISCARSMQNIEMNNCVNTGKIKGVAGLVAAVNARSSVTSTITINNSYNTGEIITTRTYNGGIAGYLDTAEQYITNCYNTGKITGGGYTGGILGRAYIKTHITNCYNTGEIIATEGYIGGIVGTYTKEGVIRNDAPELKIEKCYNTGKITGNSGNVAGIAGQISSEGTRDTIKYCYNTGNVETTGSYVAGIVGQMYGGKILDCYNRGDVKGSGYASGILAESGSSTKIEITNTYNTGIITAGYNMGGIHGYGYNIPINNSYNIGVVKFTEGASENDYKGSISGGNITAQNCYYLKDTCNVAVGGGSYSSQDGTTQVETLDQMKQLLNTNVTNLQGWKQGQDGYPTIDM